MLFCATFISVVYVGLYELSYNEKSIFLLQVMAPQNLENTVLIHFLNFVSENTEMCLKITWGVSDRL